MRLNYTQHRKHYKQHNTIKISLICLILIALLYILVTIVTISKKKNTNNGGSAIKKSEIKLDHHQVVELPANTSNNSSSKNDVVKKEEEENDNEKANKTSTTKVPNTTTQMIDLSLLQMITTKSTILMKTTNGVTKLQLKKLVKNLARYSKCILENVEHVSEKLTSNSFDELEELIRAHCFIRLFGRYSGRPCSWPPQKLVGPLQVDFTPVEMKTLHNKLKYVQQGGKWSPNHCTPRQEVVVVIPFRDRNSHLSVFLNQIHDILKRQEYAYQILVVEQHDEYPFNRGKLMNIGYKEALKLSPFTCFVFHDVDLIPENDKNDYGCPTSPRHLSHAVDKFDYKLPYNGIFGGVEAFLKQDFERINGFSNSYWGWGAEDDDLYKRITQNGFALSRPSIQEGRYKMIKHVSSRDAPPNRHDKLNHAHETYQTDGISTLQYKVLNVKIEPLYTLIQVDLNIEEDAIY